MSQTKWKMKAYLRSAIQKWLKIMHTFSKMLNWITLSIQRTLEMMYEGEVVSKEADENDFYKSFRPATFEIDSFHL